MPNSLNDICPIAFLHLDLGNFPSEHSNKSKEAISNPIEKLVILVMLDTGLRVSELCTYIKRPNIAKIHILLEIFTIRNLIWLEISR